jgi:hypothetical protein
VGALDVTVASVDVPPAAGGVCDDQKDAARHQVSLRITAGHSPERGVTRRLSVRATPGEQSLSLPGDDLIPNAVGTLTHAVTVECGRRDLWPWLVQMGAGRAGWYSYDWVDNGRHPSADRIVPGLQHSPIHSIFPALPDCQEGFVLVEQEANHWLVFGWPAETGGYIVTWAFVLMEIGAGRTRLIVRARASDEYRFHGLPRAIGLWMARAVHFLMQRKQLIGIARRAERRAAS